MIELLRTDFFVVGWKVVVFLIGSGLMIKIVKSAIESWKKSGGLFRSIIDEIIFGILVFIVAAILLSTDLASIVIKFTPTVQWLMDKVIDAFKRVTNIPLG